MSLRLYYILGLISIFNVSAQKGRDTIYFNVDQDYIINLDQYLSIDERERKIIDEERRWSTQTLGYIYYKADSIIEKHDLSEPVYNLREYIENREFYYDGHYNKIIDPYKLTEKLLDRYSIFFVDEDQIIRPKRDPQKENLIPLNRASFGYARYKYFQDNEGEIIKDTLFFNYDEHYLTIQSKEPNKILTADTSMSEYSLYFKKEENINNLRKPEVLLSISDFIRKSRFYRGWFHGDIYLFDLRNYLSNYVMIFVRDKEMFKASMQIHFQSAH